MQPSWMSTAWIPKERLDSLLQVEPLTVLLALALSSAAVYRFLLKEVSEDRHRLLKDLLANLGGHIVALLLLFGTFHGLSELSGRLEHPVFAKLAGYIGLVALFSGATVFVKTAKILIFEYLFIGHMKEGVPVLLVNLFTLLLSIVIGAWMLAEIFGVKLTPLLATSAIFSIVLGLALQDTLGNLFAGVALQFDKPCEIGDWVEIVHGPQKWVGQVHEVTWRATVLIGLSDELITLPNRIVGQSQVSNFSIDDRPIVRSQTLRLPYSVDIDAARTALIEAAKSVEKVRHEPSPLVYCTEAAESWLTVRLIYFLDDFGTQWSVGDRVLEAALDRLKRAGITLASPRIEILK